MNTRRLLIALTIALAWQTETLAGPHTLTYVERVEPLGTQVTLGGDTFDLVRIPVRLYSGARYAFIVPAIRWDPTSAQWRSKPITRTSRSPRTSRSTRFRRARPSRKS